MCGYFPQNTWGTWKYLSEFWFISVCFFMRSFGAFDNFIARNERVSSEGGYEY